MNVNTVGLVETTASTTNNIATIDETSLPWRIFKAFASNKQFYATNEELVAYVSKELNLTLDQMQPNVVENLPVIAIAAINMWSGFDIPSEFLIGELKKDYFDMFEKFLLYKINTMLKETLANPEVGVSQHAISIGCPADVLNTIVFSNVEDDVVMKRHLGAEWSSLSTMQLINLPYVEVRFSTDDICFVRRQATDFARFLYLHPADPSSTKDDVIEHVVSLNKKSCYSYNFLEEYFREYIRSLRLKEDLQSDKLEEICTILSEFLEDIKFIDVNQSIATNTYILFRLSQVPFVRNKKLIKPNSKNEDEPIGYCEIITPKVELVLLHFKAKQNDTPHISFEYTDTIKKKETPPERYLPLIEYKCTFCMVEFNTSYSKTQMIKHLKLKHTAEQNVCCTVCKKQFEVLNLAAARWRHKCIQTATK